MVCPVSTVISAAPRKKKYIPLLSTPFPFPLPVSHLFLLKHLHDTILRFSLYLAVVWTWVVAEDCEATGFQQK